MLVIKTYIINHIILSEFKILIIMLIILLSIFSLSFKLIIHYILRYIHIIGQIANDID